MLRRASLSTKHWPADLVVPSLVPTGRNHRVPLVAAFHNHLSFSYFIVISEI